MTAPLWTMTVRTDDHGHRTETPLTPQQIVLAAGCIAGFLAYGKYDRPLVSDGVGHTLTTSTVLGAVEAAVGRLLNAADHAGTPITTATITANTQVYAIARKLGTPQWA